MCFPNLIPNRFSFQGRIALGSLLFILVLMFQGTTLAQETVHLRSPTNAGSLAKIQGTVLEYNGSTIQIELPTGQTLQYPSDRVEKIETEHSTAYLSALDSLTGGNEAAALRGFQTALQQETRGWVRREILAHQVQCYQRLQQPISAAHTFLLLWESDPQTPYFDRIPLRWHAEELSQADEQQAKRWMENPENPAAQLLGASFLLNRYPQSAQETLRRLESTSRPYLPALAKAQGWRAELVTNSVQVPAWDTALESIPEELRGGPLLVVGQAWLRQKEYESAALRLMEAAILYPEQTQVAAQALHDAGLVMAAMNQPDEAARLWQELIERFPQQNRLVQQARQRLQQF
ncbi:Hypothetical protein PBC10988_32080 [Planctomycetales bacterium 10988]|nr:Hypothetical protein PBC10988_32080 [Planctomycetales bacterium 10988]